MEDIEKMTEHITEGIKKAANNSITKSTPRVKSQIKSKPFWNEKCSNATKERNKQKNKINKSSSQEELDKYKVLKGKAQQTIKEAKSECWQNFCDSLKDNEKLGSVWKMAKKIDGNSSKKQIPVLKK